MNHAKFIRLLAIIDLTAQDKIAPEGCSFGNILPPARLTAITSRTDSIVGYNKAPLAPSSTVATGPTSETLFIPTMHCQGEKVWLENDLSQVHIVFTIPSIHAQSLQIEL